MMESPDAKEFLCRRCRATLPKQFFARDRSRNSGRSKYCRVCNAEKCNRWYSENHAAHIAKVRERKRDKSKILILGIVETKGTENAQR